MYGYWFAHICLPLVIVYTISLFDSEKDDNDEES